MFVCVRVMYAFGPIFPHSQQHYHLWSVCVCVSVLCIHAYMYIGTTVRVQLLMQLKLKELPLKLHSAYNL